ncbi:MAG TPA: IPT/TIG domain-containing protein [Mycobacteriales bacterium]|nr:IPT/TIG domain-containing protein [Mycobacteriales bacterium]
MAVGTDSGIGAIDVESDGKWRAVPSGARTGASSTDLVSVSCPAAGACVAVGTSGSQGVIETQKGSSWSGTLATGSDGALLSSYQGSLSSVSCPAAGSCAAVGQAIVNNPHTGLLDTDGLIADLVPSGKKSVWSARKAPEYYKDAPEGASLASVSCSKPGECRAVGYALDDSSNHYQYALVDDAKNYAWFYGSAAVPADTDGGSAALRSISCIGDTFICMASGYYPEKNHGAMPMIQTIDAVDHAQVTAGLLPIEDTSAELLATSCASDGTCESVGDAYDSPGDPTYGYGWDGYIVSHTYGAPAGKSAGVVASNTRSPGDANTVQHNEALTAASCTVGGVCIAVGHYLDTKGYEAGVIDTRKYDSDGNITKETDVRAPEPANDPSTDDQALLNGVSCNNSTHCVAVGSYLNDSNPHGVIESLGGASPPPPTITRITPAHGHPSGGTKVTISGLQLAHVTAVKFGNKSGTGLHVVSSTELTVKAPAHAAGVVNVRVLTGGGVKSSVTAADHYTYVDRPVVTNVSPAKGTHHGGNKVTITGHHLSGATKVKFGGAAVGHVKVLSAGSIVVTAPAHSVGQVDVRVVTKGGTSKADKNDAYRFT